MRLTATMTASLFASFSGGFLLGGRLLAATLRSRVETAISGSLVVLRGFTATLGGGEFDTMSGYFVLFYVNYIFDWRGIGWGDWG